jgi:hypothetical protein
MKEHVGRPAANMEIWSTCKYKQGLKAGKKLLYLKFEPFYEDNRLK